MFVYPLLALFATVAASNETCEFVEPCYQVMQVLRYIEDHPCHGSRLEKPQSSYLATGTERTRLGEIVRQVKTFFPAMNFDDFQACLPEIYSLNYLCEQMNFDCGPTDSYRTYDGSCNNIHNPHWGAIGTQQIRRLPPNFDDEFSSPRRQSVDGSPLPNPRTISNAVLHEIHPDEQPEFTMWVWGFGQVLDHDITLTPVAKNQAGKEIYCCKSEQKSQCGSVCSPIPIPDGDPHFSYTGQTCINFVRSVSTPCCSKDCQRTPINMISAVIDGTPTYGNDDEQAASFRVDGTNGEPGKGAKLKVESGVDDEGGLLPRGHDQTKCRDGGPHGTPFCSESGDIRVHVLPSLTAIITMFHREHNRIVDGLIAVNPNWNEERLYQEARKIVMAEYQKITMDDLNIILGEDIMKLYGLNVVPGYRNTYDKSVNPQIALHVSTAAFRFGHSFVNMNQGQRNRFNNKTVIEHLLHQHFDRANFTQTEEGVSGILRFLGHKCMGKADGHLTQEIRNLLFLEEEQPISLDIGSLNIMRGRDHGLPPYNKFRKLYNLPEFPAGHDDIVASKILDVYNGNPHDIDLFVGGLTERRAGSLVGELFAHMIGEQFSRFVTGDRYHYQNEPDAETDVGRFQKEAQVMSIQNITLARLICANTETTRIQPNVFLKEGPGNEMVDCHNFDAIPDIDFGYWQEH